MKVPKTEQNSKNASLSGMHKEENHPTPGSLPPSNPPNTPGGDAGGNIKTEIKQEGSTELVGDIKKELQHNGLDASLDDLNPSLDDVKPKIEDCLSSLADQDGDSKVLGGNMGHDIPSTGIPTPNNGQNPLDGSGNPMGGAGGNLPPGSIPNSNMGGHGVVGSGGQLTPMDGHFLQQQSQIFVFSTSMANKAAESVRMGQHKSIRDFHLDQEGTKKFLEKNKMLFPPNRPGMSVQPGGEMSMGNNMPGLNGSKGSPQVPNNTMSSVEQWVRTQNANLEQGHFSSPTDAAMNHACLSPMAQNMPPGMVVGGRNMMGPGGGNSGPQPPPQDMQSPGAMDSPNFPNMAGLGPPDGQGNLSQSKVPDDNLTPEQLQRREERLANLRKLQAMLFPEQRGPGGGHNGPPGGPPHGMMGPGGPPGGMVPPGMMPGGPQMSSGPGMHSPNSMISSMAGGPPMGPGGGPHMGPGAPFPGAPPNFENMTPSQREWFKLQSDYYNDKRRKQEMDRMRHIQQMQQMGMNIPPGEAPPHFFRMRGPGMPPGPMSPTSPNFPGPMGPNDPAFMMGPRHPGPMSMPGGPNFDPMGPMGPGGPMGFPFGKEEMMRPPMKGGPMPMIQRAGNPEQFNDMIPPISTPGSGGTTKPPPPYGQSNKRKRSGDDMDELYKKLQPAPSPQQFSYLNQFEGQELTITKQLNMAYQEQPEKSPAQQPPTSQPPPQQQNSGPLPSHPHPKSQPTSKPPTPSSQTQPSPRPPVTSSTSTPSNAPNNNCNSAPPPSSNVSSPHPISRPSSRPSSVSGTTTSAGAMLPPSPLTLTSQTDRTQPPSSTQVTGSNTSSQRLSHYDLPGSQLPPGGGKAAKGGGSNKEHMNITSTNLVNLAKGVEHLSNQMQQNMMQGGPFHNIQIQGQISEMDNNHPGMPPGGGGGGGPSVPGGMPPGAGGPPPQPQQQQTPGSCSMDSQGHPSVNNTFVNATMSIGQLNIQSIHPGQGGGNFSANMQTQQMNNEMMGPGPPHPHPHPHNMPHNTGGMMNSQMMPDPMSKMPPCSQASMAPGGMQRPFPGHSPSLSNAGGEPGFPKTPANAPVGNASVQIQAKAPNTIQYLPAHPPTSQPGQVPRKGDIGEMGGGGIPPRFPSPLPNLEPLQSGRPTSRNKFMPPGGGGGGGGGQMPNSPLEMMNPGIGGGGISSGGPPPHMGGPGGGPHPPPMGMQQSMMVPGGGSMQQQMGGPGPGMPYSCPSPMHPGPGGPSPVGPMGPEMMQSQMQGQHMSMQGPGGPMMGGHPGGMRGEPGMMGGGHPGVGSGMMGGQGGYSAQYHQFQQQLYAQGRPRGSSGMNPAGMGGMPQRMMVPEHMMMHGGPGMGPGGMPMDMLGGGMGPGPMMGGPGMMGGPQGMGGPIGPGGMGNMMGPGMPNMP